MEKVFFLMTYISPRKGKRHSTFKKIFKSTMVIECVESSLSSSGTEECQFSKSPCEHTIFMSMKNLNEAQFLLRLNNKKNWGIPDWAKAFSLSTSFATWETWFSMLYKLILGTQFRIHLAKVLFHYSSSPCLQYHCLLCPILFSLPGFSSYWEHTYPPSGSRTCSLANLELCENQTKVKSSENHETKSLNSF